MPVFMKAAMKSVLLPYPEPNFARSGSGRQSSRSWQVGICVDTALMLPNIEPLQKVMDQPVAQVHQLLECGGCRVVLAGIKLHPKTKLAPYHCLAVGLRCCRSSAKARWRSVSMPTKVPKVFFWALAT
jgi:hypothetical protein